MEPRQVWVHPPPRPAPPAWVKHDPLLDAPEPDWVPGTLLEWRMTDPETRAWTGMVRYAVNGLTYELWLDSSRIRNTPPDTT